MKTYSTKLIEIDSRSTDFPGFKWLLKAVDFEPGSPISNVLSIEKDQIVSTDGHRLHIYQPLEVYPTGIFKILLRQKYFLIFAETKDVKFPEYQRVIPDYTKFKAFEISSLIERNYFLMAQNMEDCGGLRFRYFNDLGTDMEKMFIGADKDPVVFEGFRRQALIMPMRI